MDFALNETQVMIRDTLRRSLAGSNPAALRESGMFAALVPEAQGGLAGGGIEAMVIAEEIGRAGLVTDFTETAVLAGGLIAALGTDEQRERLLALLAARELSVAFIPTQAGLTLRAGETRPMLDGHAAIVPNAPDAGLLMVIARVDGELRAYIVAPDAPGLTMTPFAIVDGGAAASLTFAGVSAEALGETGAVGPALDVALDAAVTAQSAERVGLMAMLIERTVEHLRTREQFGQRLGDFQALQHRLANMLIAYELSRSIVMKAAIVASGDDARARTRAASAAKVTSVEAARLVGHGAIQMHGAMGMTNELPVGAAVRRIRALDSRLGSADAHLARYRAARSVPA